MNAIMGVLLAAVIGLVGLSHFETLAGKQHDREVIAVTAGEFATLLEGTAKYLSDHQADLSANIGVGGSGYIALSDLEADSDIQQGFSQSNPYGQTWVIYVMQPSSGELNGYVLSEGGETLDLPHLSSVTALASSASGFVPPDGIISNVTSASAYGSEGGWVLNLSGKPNPGSGHFFGQTNASSSSSVQSDSLYRDAVANHPELNAMNTTLNMDGNSITNGDNVGAATGTFTGNIGARGVSPDTVPPGWAGGVSTWDLAAQGTIGAGPAGQAAKSYINSSGDGYVSDDFTAGDKVTANILKANSTVQFEATASEGQSCSPELALTGSNDDSGTLLYCHSGVWTEAVAHEPFSHFVNEVDVAGGASANVSNNGSDGGTGTKTEMIMTLPATGGGDINTDYGQIQYRVYVTYPGVSSGSQTKIVCNAGVRSSDSHVSGYGTDCTFTVPAGSSWSMVNAGGNAIAAVILE